jgi:hypothetical protein
MSTRYLCYFRFRNGDLLAASGNGPSAFNQGFWITDGLEYTTGMDAKYWIPPHQIHYVEAIRLPDLGEGSSHV